MINKYQTLKGYRGDFSDFSCELFFGFLDSLDKYNFCGGNNLGVFYRKDDLQTRLGFLINKLFHTFLIHQ